MPGPGALRAPAAESGDGLAAAAPDAGLAETRATALAGLPAAVTCGGRSPMPRWLGTIGPPQVTSLSRKPLSISMEEIEAGKIVYERPEVVEKSIK